MTKLNNHFALLFTCVAVIGFVGCSSGDGNVGLVEGTVTVDGEPIEEALVTFYPTTGRASGGYTNAEGKYNLSYVAKQKGAVVGEHKVTITSKVLGLSPYDEGYEEGSKSRKEFLPKKYRDRAKTELTATVNKGSNEINFDLKLK